mmetsp:Transcript_1920/g.8462  ORF Transcript_1920/g.8462 Transcript_1920/m.8462 type:complete len:233 (+) Transcript_1920:561-1259(+)
MARHESTRSRTPEADVAPNARPRIGWAPERRKPPIVRRLYPRTPRRRVRTRGERGERGERRRERHVSPRQNRKRSARQRQGSTGGTEERVVPGPEVRRHRRRRRAAPAGGAAPVRPRAAAEQARVSPAVQQAGPAGPRRHVGLAHRRPPAPRPQRRTRRTRRLRPGVHPEPRRGRRGCGHRAQGVRIPRSRRVRTRILRADGRARGGCRASRRRRRPQPPRGATPIHRRVRG